MTPAPPAADAGRPLSYAPPPPGRRRRRARRVGLVLLAVGIAFAGWRWGPAARDRAGLLYWQHRCATYAPPADQIVYASGPTDVAALKPDPAYVVQPFGPPTGAPVAARRPPDCFDRYPPAEAMAVSSSIPPGPVLFLHERRTPGGERRIVVVRLYPVSWVPIVSHTIGPAGLWAGPTVDPRPGISTAFFYTTDPTRHRLRIFAGQPDPADLSRFTIAYELDGQPGTVLGQLTDTPAGPAVVLTAPPPVNEPVILE